MKEGVYKLPQEFLHKIAKIYPHHYTKICETFLSKKISSFRINYCKIDLTSLRRELLQEHVKSRELSFPKGAFLLTKTTLRDFQKRDVYLQGKVYVQNVSSMLPILALDPKDGEEILDLCAAPGTKTTQIFSLAPGAVITAVEKNRIRYYKLMANLKIQGADTVKVLLLDGMWVRKKFPESFDKILVDAPCSAEGRFNVINPRTFQYWKPRKVKEMVNTQKKLLNAAFYALKPQGELVYSTCTFSPEENEEIINWFINKFEGQIELLPIKFPLSNIVDGFIRWKDLKFSPTLRLAKRIIPNEYMEGFFVAKLKKIYPSLK